MDLVTRPSFPVSLAVGQLKAAKMRCQLRHISLAVSMQQLENHCMDFH
jgi:hypothetical protein